MKNGEGWVGSILLKLDFLLDSNTASIVVGRENKNLNVRVLWYC